MRLNKLKRYPMAEAVYLQAFGVSEQELEAEPREEVIADYAHLEENVEEAIEDALTNREQTVLRRVLGDKMPLRAVGEECGLTTTRMRQVMNKAFHKIRLPYYRQILDGTRRRERIEAEAEHKRKVAIAAEWSKVGMEIEHQKEKQQAQVSAQLEYRLEYLTLTPVCEQKLHALGIERVGELLEKFPYDPQTNGLTGLAIADGIDESDYCEIWSALFTAGLLIRLPELPDFEALKKAEQVTAICGEVSYILEMPVDELDLSVRSYNCLVRAGFRSVGELFKKLNLDVDGFLTTGREELIKMMLGLNIRNIGRKSTEEIVDRIGEVLNGDF